MIWLYALSGVAAVGLLVCLGLASLNPELSS